MAHRHGRRGAHRDPPLADLDRVLADDARIDAIGAGRWSAVARGHRALGAGAQHATGRRHDDEPLLDLFEQWRIELDARPLPPMVRLPSAAPSRRRTPTMRPMLAVAAAISALIIGSATIGASDAEPGSPWWPITRMIWPARAQAAAATLAVHAALDDAREAMRSGRDDDALAAIIRAEGELGNVDDSAVRASIQEAVGALWAATTASGARTAVPTTSSTPADPTIRSTRGPATDVGRVAPLTAGSAASSAPAVAVSADPTGTAVPPPASAPEHPVTAVPVEVPPAVDLAVGAQSPGPSTATTSAPTEPTVTTEPTGPTEPTVPTVPTEPTVPTPPEPTVTVDPPAATATPSDAPAAATEQSAPSPTEVSESEPDVARPAADDPPAGPASTEPVSVAPAVDATGVTG